MSGLECLDDRGGRSKCSGPVEYRWPGYGEKLWPRCERHGEKRLELQREIGRAARSSPPADFDPLDAGEVWDEDDY